MTSAARPSLTPTRAASPARGGRKSAAGCRRASSALCPPSVCASSRALVLTLKIASLRAQHRLVPDHSRFVHHRPRGPHHGRCLALRPPVPLCTTHSLCPSSTPCSPPLCATPCRLSRSLSPAHFLALDVASTLGCRRTLSPMQRSRLCALQSRRASTGEQTHDRYCESSLARGRRGRGVTAKGDT